MIEHHDGSLSIDGLWTKVIYRGKEYPAPVDITVLMAYDYILYLLKNKLV